MTQFTYKTDDGMYDVEKLNDAGKFKKDWDEEKLQKLKIKIKDNDFYQKLMKKGMLTPGVVTP